MFISNYKEGEIGHLIHDQSPLFQIKWHGLHKSVLQRYGTEQEILVEKTEIFLPVECVPISNEFIIPTNQ